MHEIITKPFSHMQDLVAGLERDAVNIVTHPGTGGYILRVSSITMSRYCSSWEASYMDLSYKQAKE